MYRKTCSHWGGVFAVLIVGTSMLIRPVAAETASVEATSDLNKQAEIARLLEIAKRGRAAVRPFDGALDVTGRPAIGRVDAPLVMVEFGGYQCGYCRKHHFDTMPSIKSTYIDTGKLRYVFFDFALDSRHEYAAKAAEAAHCAHEQGNYWGYRGQLYRNSKALSPEFLSAHARAAGLDEAAFDACIERGRYADKPLTDRTLSRELRVRGTPSFFLAHPDKENGQRLTLVKRINGARSIEFFAAQLDPLVHETSITHFVSGSASAKTVID
jgi:protein-disulfide isomerase